MSLKESSLFKINSFSLQLEYICDLYEVPMLEAPEIDIEEDLE